MRSFLIHCAGRPILPTLPNILILCTVWSTVMAQDQSTSLPVQLASSTSLLELSPSTRVQPVLFRRSDLAEESATTGLAAFTTDALADVGFQAPSSDIGVRGAPSSSLAPTQLAEDVPTRIPATVAVTITNTVGPPTYTTSSFLPLRVKRQDPMSEAIADAMIPDGQIRVVKPPSPPPAPAKPVVAKAPVAPPVKPAVKPPAPPPPPAKPAAAAAKPAAPIKPAAAPAKPPAPAKPAGPAKPASPAGKPAAALPAQPLKKGPPALIPAGAPAPGAAKKAVSAPGPPGGGGTKKMPVSQDGSRGGRPEKSKNRFHRHREARVRTRTVYEMHTARAAPTVTVTATLLVPTRRPTPAPYESRHRDILLDDELFDTLTGGKGLPWQTRLCTPHGCYYRKSSSRVSTGRDYDSSSSRRHRKGSTSYSRHSNKSKHRNSHVSHGRLCNNGRCSHKRSITAAH